MTLIIVDCEEPTIVSLCDSILEENQSVKHTSIEESQAKQNSLVVGKVLKVISYSPEAKRYIILIKEYLPCHEYGVICKAVIEGALARKLFLCSPQIGDRVAFLQPIVFNNPAYEPIESCENKKRPKYVLHNTSKEDALMWFGKKRIMGGKSDDDKCVRQTRLRLSTSAELRPQGAVSSAAGQSAAGGSGAPSKQSYAVQTVTNVRQKPHIQLPQKLQIPSNTKPLNPNYKYETISSIHSTDLTRHMQKSINFFGVVHEIIKPISSTRTNKYTMICILIDDSNKESNSIMFHFFTPDDTIIKQIEVGDTLRLHRVKLEQYNGRVDGRVFFNQDIVLFKKDDTDVRLITTAKNTLITDEEKLRVETLRKWYSEFVRTPTLLSDITKRGKFCIFCKVVHKPQNDGSTVRVTVTDGSVIKNLIPATHVQRYHHTEDQKDHIVTEIIARENLKEYGELKVNDFVLFFNVEAVPSESNNRLQLEIDSDTPPEVEDATTLQAADIECRIEQFLKSLNESSGNDSENNKQENSEEIAEQNVNNLPSSSNRVNETRLQKNKRNTSPAKTMETNVASSKDDSDTKNTESDPGTKSRKQLFTPNYMTDLSDAATDETSEHNVEVSKNTSHKVSEEVVNPANTNFSDIVEKVKTKYLTPKTPDQSSPTQEEERVVRRSSGRKRRNGKYPVVILERISESEGCSDSKSGVGRKRSLDDSQLQEDIEDAETIINISCRAHRKSLQRNKRTRLESMSTEENNPGDSDMGLDQELRNRDQKVTSWLFQQNTNQSTENSEFSLEVLKHILRCTEDSPDMSQYVSALCFRIKAFLLEVVPDPSSNPLDLVSGYCKSGCQGMFLFSTIEWRTDENSRVPLCPECIQIEQEKELQMMLMMELHILDTNGCHSAVLAVRNHAEQFLNCSVTEFVRDEVVRTSRVRMLSDYSLQNTYHASFTPLLDMGVCPLNKTSPTLILVNSTLKLPRF